MKRIAIMSMAILMAALVPVSSLASDKDKKKKKEKSEIVKQVRLVTSADSLSYAAGYRATQGLLNYLQNQLHVDTTYMSEFLRGYKEVIEKGEDPAFTAYIVGTQIANQAKTQIFPGMNKSLAGTADSLRATCFHEGFLAGVAEDTTVYSMTSASELFDVRMQAITARRNAAYKAENEAWLKANSTKQGVVVLPSGLQYKVLKNGTGVKPTVDQTVEVIYEGKTIDGHIFDATSRHPGQKTDSFRCNQVIKGWTEALTNMPVGSKWEIYIPQNLGYGAREAGQIKPFSTLIFTVELVSIQPEEKASKKSK